MQAMMKASILVSLKFFDKLMAEKTASRSWIQLTDAKLAIEPKPSECHALHPTFSSRSNVVIDLMKDTTTNDGDGDGEKYETKNQAQDEFFALADVTSPENCNW